MCSHLVENRTLVFDDDAYLTPSMHKSTWHLWAVNIAAQMKSKMRRCWSRLGKTSCGARLTTSVDPLYMGTWQAILAGRITVPLGLNIHREDINS